ncbi:hypothetical protein SAMN07250955_10383 [Arboricoccus pini]|uniref:Uncharacterized protein n=1 Tax=Arboricoccus pini TaxID=1963835 RepID=A0A212QRS8_9PROT|nr:hypothetical protein SAMN07250955_10383 [Arboricoccus pini]
MRNRDVRHWTLATSCELESWAGDDLPMKQGAKRLEEASGYGPSEKAQRVVPLFPAPWQLGGQCCIQPRRGTAIEIRERHFATGEAPTFLRQEDGRAVIPSGSGAKISGVPNRSPLAAAQARRSCGEGCRRGHYLAAKLPARDRSRT